MALESPTADQATSAVSGLLNFPAWHGEAGQHCYFWERRGMLGQGPPCCLGLPHTRGEDKHEGWGGSSALGLLPTALFGGLSPNDVGSLRWSFSCSTSWGSKLFLQFKTQEELSVSMVIPQQSVLTSQS